MLDKNFIKKILVFCLFLYIKDKILLLGYIFLQSSHSKLFQRKDVEHCVCFICNLLFKQSCRHLMCIYCIVPAHLQGVTKGLSLSEVSHRQILQENSQTLLLLAVFSLGSALFCIISYSIYKSVFLRKNKKFKEN